MRGRSAALAPGPRCPLAAGRRVSGALRAHVGGLGRGGLPEPPWPHRAALRSGPGPSPASSPRRASCGKFLALPRVARAPRGRACTPGLAAAVGVSVGLFSSRVNWGVREWVCAGAGAGSDAGRCFLSLSVDPACPSSLPGLFGLCRWRCGAGTWLPRERCKREVWQYNQLLGLA